MTAADEVPDEGKRLLPRWLAVLLGTPPAIFMVVMLGFIIRSEVAHDEEDCPFVAVERRNVGDGVAVAEEARSCQEGIEERRWILQRDGRPPRELGRRRIDSHLYEDDAYRWRTERIEGRVRVIVHNPGIPDGEYDEVEPEDLRKQRGR
jgi:hypothetical protein